MNTEKENSIEVKLIDEISKDNILKISEDITEIALDSFLEDGILKVVPAISFITGTIKTTLNIREKIFAKKVLTFLSSLKNIPNDKRQEFINKLNQKKGFKQRLGETVIVLLEKIDNLNKPIIIGNLFKAYILEKISLEDFTKISSSVSRVDIDDLMKFARYKEEKKTLPIEIKESLAFNGLMSITISTKPLTADMTEIRQDLVYKENSTGRKLIEYGIKNAI